MQDNGNRFTVYVGDIKKKALFLEEKGFRVVNVGEYTIRYSRRVTCIIDIYYGRYSDAAEVYIRYENNGLLRPEQYSLGWLQNMKKFEMGERDIFRKAGEVVNKLVDIFSLLEYLQENFDDVTNIEFCRKTQKKINEIFEKGIW